MGVFIVNKEKEQVEEKVEEKKSLQDSGKQSQEEKVEKQKRENSGDKLTLGGGIELSGFKTVDLGMMVVVKKIVGSYARKFSDDNKDFEKLSVSLDGKKLSGELTVGGKAKTSEVEEDNLFVTLDKVMKGLE